MHIRISAYIHTGMYVVCNIYSNTYILLSTYKYMCIVVTVGTKRPMPTQHTTYVAFQRVPVTKITEV